MTLSLLQVEAEMFYCEEQLFRLAQDILEDAEVVDLILAGNDSARSKSRRLKIVRQVRQRVKNEARVWEELLARLELGRARILSGEIEV